MRRQNQNVTAERAVLGSMLVDPSLIHEMGASFTDDLFTVDTHKNMARAMLTLQQSNREIAMSAVLSYLPPPSDDAEPFSPEAYCYLLMKEHATDTKIAQDLLSDLIVMRGRRKLVEISQRMLAASSTDDRDPSEVLEELVSEARSSITNGAVKSVRLADGMKLALDNAQARRRGLRTSGYPWHIPGLNKTMGLMMDGNLIGVLADAKMGKTSFGLQCARHLCQFGPGDVFSLEMTEEEVSTRLLSQESRVDEDTIASGSYSDAEFEAISQAQAVLYDLPFHIIDKTRMTVAKIRAKCMEDKRRRGLRWVILDHLKLILPEGRPRDLTERYEQIMTDLKTMAKDLECVVILLMQRTRGSMQREENPRPRVDDIFGGGATVENCNAILAVWRLEEWLEKNRPDENASTQKRRYKASEETPTDRYLRDLERWRGKAELITLARRRGRGNQSVVCNFIGECNRFDPEESTNEPRFLDDSPF